MARHNKKGDVEKASTSPFLLWYLLENKFDSQELKIPFSTFLIVLNPEAFNKNQLHKELQ